MKNTDTHRLPLTIIITAILLVITACQPQVETTPTAAETATVEVQTSDSAGLSGTVADCADVSELAGGLALNVYTAAYYGENSEDGFYMLDLATTVQAAVGEDCSFHLIGVTGGTYVLLVGVTPESAWLLVDDAGNQVVFDMQSSSAQEAGTLYVQP